MCGATDCPSCGPAQGYEVVQVYDPKRRHMVTMNVEDAIEAGLYVEDDEQEEFCDDE